MKQHSLPTTKVAIDKSSLAILQAQAKLSGKSKLSLGEINAAIREGLEDIKAGRVSKTFTSVKELMADLNKKKGKRSKTKKTR